MMIIETDYKVLYEQTQAELEKFKNDMAKLDVENILNLNHQLKDQWNKEDIRSEIKREAMITSLSILGRNESEILIRKLGFDKLWGIIKNRLKEIEAEEQAEVQPDVSN